MLVQTTQMQATLYTVIFHSSQAAAAFEIETELKDGVFYLKRTSTAVSFGLLNPVQGKLWAKDFEDRWIARLESEFKGQGDPPAPTTITESFHESYHGPIDNVDTLINGMTNTENSQVKELELEEFELEEEPEEFELENSQAVNEENIHSDTDAVAS